MRIVFIICSIVITFTKSQFNISQRFQNGDIVDDFKLDKRLEFLGISKSYHREDDWGVDEYHLPLSYTEMKMNNSDVYKYLEIPKERRVDIDNTCIKNGSYCLDENIFLGGHGEIWRAHKINKKGYFNQNITFILKRMSTLNRPDILRCAIREIYFGEFFHGTHSIARYESFFIIGDDYWLVFRYEGLSLQALLYAVTYNEGSNAILKPSNAWKKLRTTETGQNTLREIVHQLISGVLDLHEKGIVHRDLKPSNILLNVDEEQPRLIIADFSSALSNKILQDLYPPSGPSINEETLLYAPPEVLLSINEDADADAFFATPRDQTDEVAYFESRPESYDIWSLGVMFLELILGTANVFEVDQRTIAMIVHKLKRKKLDNAKNIKNALLIASLAEYCIYNKNEKKLFYRNDKKKKFKRKIMKSEKVTSEKKNMKSINEHSLVLSNINKKSEIKSLALHGPLINKNGNNDLSVEKINASNCVTHSGGNENNKLLLGFENSNNQYCQTPLALKQTNILSNKKVNEIRKHKGNLKDNIRFSAFIQEQLDSVSKNYHPHDGRKRRQQEEERQKQQIYLSTTFSNLHENFDLTKNNITSTKTRKQKKMNSKKRDEIFFRCSNTKNAIENFQNALLKRDPLGTVFNDKWAIDLLLKLLHFNPNKRISLKDALQHAYFRGTFVSSFDDSEHATASELKKHDEKFVGKILDSNDQEQINIADTDEKNIESISNLKETNNNRINKKIDYFSNNKIDRQISKIEFKCPLCNRVFVGDYVACLKHVKARKHGNKCVYDTRLLPDCLSDHIMLPLDAQSGWCDLKGKRKYIEDVHAMFFDADFKFFGVFDGHSKSFAAKFASQHVYGLFKYFLFNFKKLTRDIEKKSLIKTHARDSLALYRDSFFNNVSFSGLSNMNLNDSFVGSNNFQREQSIGKYGLYFDGFKRVNKQNSIPFDRFRFEENQKKILLSASPKNEQMDMSFIKFSNKNDIIFSHKEKKFKTNLQNTKQRKFTAQDIITAIKKSFVYTNNRLFQIKNDLVSTQEKYLFSNKNSSTVAPPTFFTSNYLKSSSLLSSSSNQLVEDEKLKKYVNSGTTAAVAVMFPQHLLVAHVGDSRIVLCCGWNKTSAAIENIRNTKNVYNERSQYNENKVTTKKYVPNGMPIQLTLDHTPYSKSESLKVKKRGGVVDSIASRDGILRVNGKLAVTRSLGDAALGEVLSPDPDILLLKLGGIENLNNGSGDNIENDENCKKTHIKNRNGKYCQESDIAKQNETNVATSESSNNWCVKYQYFVSNLCETNAIIEKKSFKQNAKIKHNNHAENSLLKNQHPSTFLSFLVIGSDGLWDVMTNDDVSEFVCEFLLNKYEQIKKDTSKQDLNLKINNNKNIDSINDNGRKKLPLDAFQQVSKSLALEALVRGSSDNIGVCVIDLLHYYFDGIHEDV